MTIAKASLALTALFAVSLLVGCPAEEKQTDTTQSSPVASSATSQTAATTTSTATAASAAAGASGASSSASASAPAAAGAASGTATKPKTVKSVTAKPGAVHTAMATTSSIDAKAIFSQKCAGCHGANGGGGMGPSLQHVAAKGDPFIHNRLMKGSPTKGMPAFGDTGMLKPAEVDAMVAYVKTL